MYGNGESLSGVTPYQQRIPRNNKRNKTSDTLITKKETIQGPANPSKRARYYTKPDVEKVVLNKHLGRFGIR